MKPTILFCLLMTIFACLIQANSMPVDSDLDGFAEKAFNQMKTFIAKGNLATLLADHGDDNSGVVHDN